MHEKFLYEQIAEQLADQIADGVLKAGDKLPSVRMLSQQRGISLSTAYKVYVELENKGLAEGRTRSGYYVKQRQRRHAGNSNAGNAPTPVLPPANVSEMIALVYRQLPNEQALQLSRSAPPPALLPVAKLNKSMTEALRSSPSGAGHYEQLEGNAELRTQIARQAINWGRRVRMEDVITTQGCMEALVFCLRAITSPGDIIAIETPTYFGIFNIMLSLDLQVMEIPTHSETGLDIDYLEEALCTTPIKACLFVTNFSNPTGGLMSDANKRRLVNLLARHEVPLIEDDIYGDLYFGKKRPLTCKAFDCEGLVLLCSSVSKSLAPGYRVGWCLPGRFKDAVLNIKMMHTITSATPTQAAIARFFETGRYDLHLRKLRKTLHLHSLQYQQLIEEHFPPETRVSQPQGGYALWVELPKHVDAFEVFKEALGHRISVAPGHIFSTDARFSNYIRISFGTPINPQITFSIKLLGKIVTVLAALIDEGE